jgi:hypothetical protein
MNYNGEINYRDDRDFQLWFELEISLGDVGNLFVLFCINFINFYWYLLTSTLSICIILYQLIDFFEFYRLSSFYNSFISLLWWFSPFSSLFINFHYFLLFSSVSSFSSFFFSFLLFSSLLNWLSLIYNYWLQWHYNYLQLAPKCPDFSHQNQMALHKTSTSVSSFRSSPFHGSAWPTE